MKKIFAAAIAVLILFTFTLPGEADARRGGFKSSRGSFQSTTPNKAKQDNNAAVNRSSSNSDSARSGTAATSANANRGGLAGGGFMKGLMVGGLAGLLFGGLFSSLGAFGDLLGLMVNLLAIYILFSIGRHLYMAYRERKKQQENRAP